VDFESSVREVDLDSLVIILGSQRPERASETEPYGALKNLSRRYEEIKATRIEGSIVIKA
jgi:hypothetical protein